MRMWSRKYLVVACSLLATALPACNRSDGPPDPKLKAALIGKWQETDSDRTQEFTADGKMTTEIKGVRFPFTYEWIGPNRIEWKQDVQGGGSPGGRATVAIDGDVLTMDVILLTAAGKERSDGGGVAKLKRVKGPE
jgi:hypothetical protein